LNDGTLKCAFDFVGSLLVIFTVSSLWLIEAIAIKLDSPGSVIYRGQRFGDEINQINQTNQRNQTNQINQTNQRNQINQINQINQRNQTEQTDDI
jgi:lipopolysaccharide/colanic/teichoic acid biosynthesis glycosyltransferase